MDHAHRSGDAPAERPAPAAPPAPNASTGPLGWLAVVLVMAACSAVALSLHAVGFSEADVAMVYLLGVVAAAALWGRGPGIAASLLGVGLFNLLFTVPYYSFRMDETAHVVTFAVMLVVSLITSTLTARVRQQAQLARETLAAQLALARERERLVEETQQARLEAETERLRSALLASISHDLRTPLAAIAGAGSALLEQGLDRDETTRRELLGTILEESNRLVRLVENVVHLTRLESGVEVDRQWQPLEEVIGSALARMAAALGEREVRTLIAPEAELAPIDGVLVEQALVNLLDNAVKHAGDEGPIEIGARVDGERVALSVSDHGRGLPEAERERVFEKFQRGSGARGVAGSGLGLAICRAVARAHGGEIRAEAVPGGGVRFVMSLPMGGPAPGLPPEDEEVLEPAVAEGTVEPSIEEARA